MSSTFYRLPEVCSRLNVGRSTVYRLIEDGSLQAVKIGRCTLVPAADLDRFEASLLATGVAMPRPPARRRVDTPIAS